MRWRGSLTGWLVTVSLAMVLAVLPASAIAGEPTVSFPGAEQLDDRGLWPSEAGDPSVLRAYEKLGDRFVARWLSKDHTHVFGVLNLTEDERESLSAELGVMVDRQVSRAELNQTANTVAQNLSGIRTTAFSVPYYAAAVQVGVVSQADADELIRRLAGIPDLEVVRELSAGGTSTDDPFGDGEQEWAQVTVPRVAVVVMPMAQADPHAIDGDQVGRRPVVTLRVRTPKKARKGVKAQVEVSCYSFETTCARRGKVTLRWGKGPKRRLTVRLRSKDDGSLVVRLPRLRTGSTVRAILRGADGKGVVDRDRATVRGPARGWSD